MSRTVGRKEKKNTTLFDKEERSRQRSGGERKLVNKEQCT